MKQYSDPQAAPVAHVAAPDGRGSNNPGPDARAAIARERIARYAHLLDSSIRLPGGYRIGLDGIIGLIPGIGDLVGFAASGYIVLLAARTGVSPSVQMLMIYNIIADLLLGTIPLLGDVLDFVWKANERNLVLYDEFHAHPYKGRQKNRIKAALPIVVLLGLLVLAGMIAVAVVKLVLRIVAGF